MGSTQGGSTFGISAGTPSQADIVAMTPEMSIMSKECTSVTVPVHAAHSATSEIHFRSEDSATVKSFAVASSVQHTPNAPPQVPAGQPAQLPPGNLSGVPLTPAAASDLNFTVSSLTHDGQPSVQSFAVNSEPSAHPAQIRSQIPLPPHHGAQLPADDRSVQSALTFAVQSTQPTPTTFALSSAQSGPVVPPTAIPRQVWSPMETTANVGPAMNVHHHQQQQAYHLHAQKEPPGLSQEVRREVSQGSTDTRGNTAAEAWAASAISNYTQSFSPSPIHPASIQSPAPGCSPFAVTAGLHAEVPAVPHAVFATAGVPRPADIPHSADMLLVTVSMCLAGSVGATGAFSWKRRWGYRRRKPSIICSIVIAATTAAAVARAAVDADNQEL